MPCWPGARVLPSACRCERPQARRGLCSAAPPCSSHYIHPCPSITCPLLDSCVGASRPSTHTAGQYVLLSPAPSSRCAGLLIRIQEAYHSSVLLRSCAVSVDVPTYCMLCCCCRRGGDGFGRLTWLLHGCLEEGWGGVAGAVAASSHAAAVWQPPPPPSCLLLSYWAPGLIHSCIPGQCVQVRHLARFIWFCALPQLTCPRKPLDAGGASACTYIWGLSHIGRYATYMQRAAVPTQTDRYLLIDEPALQI